MRARTVTAFAQAIPRPRPLRRWDLYGIDVEPSRFDTLFTSGDLSQSAYHNRVGNISMRFENCFSASVRNTQSHRGFDDFRPGRCAAAKAFAKPEISRGTARHIA